MQEHVCLGIGLGEVDLPKPLTLDISEQELTQDIPRALEWNGMYNKIVAELKQLRKAARSLQSLPCPIFIPMTWGKWSMEVIRGV